MTVIDLHSFKPAEVPSKTLLCLGNFDGVHIGHRALIAETVKRTKEFRALLPEVKSGVFFFRRAPHEIITGEKLLHLASFDEKLSFFSELGLDIAFVYDYEEIGKFSPEAFVSDILKKECGCIFAVCGYDFRFGYKAEGDAERLSLLMNGNTYTVSEVSLDGERVSSSNIRRFIADGNIEGANAMLGRPYLLNAEVLHGKKLGRSLGIPTINQKFPPDFAIPKKGIYISQVTVNGATFPSVSNIGVRPSVEDGASINCETYILGFSGDLYGKKITVEFLKRLRDEIKFDSVAALKAQINKDIEKTKEYFNKK